MIYTHRSFVVTTISIAALCWIAATTILVRQAVQQKNATGPGSQQKLISGNSSVEQALNASTLKNPATFLGDFDNPFRSYSAPASKPSSTGQQAIAERKKFFLKGVLYKEHPLAILADETGQTYILKEGESIDDTRLEKIDDTGARLRDRRGAYDLTVPQP